MSRRQRSVGTRKSHNSISSVCRRRFGGNGYEQLEKRNLLVASVLINEVFFNAPGDSDVFNEYIELRGTAESLDNYYLIIVENEDELAENGITHIGETGQIDRVFDLSGLSFGANGFLTLRTKNSPYTVNGSSNNYANAGSGQGWGDFSSGTSTLHVEAQDHYDPNLDADVPNPEMEGSGGTFMVIKNNGGPGNAPQVDFDLDVGNDGLDIPTGRANWEIIDAIGVCGENSEAVLSRLYAPINFAQQNNGKIEPGATLVVTNFELEYFARYGNSTGQTADDWDVANLTDRATAGFTGADFRQSGNPHPASPAGPYHPQFVLESSHGVPYGTNRTGSLGDVNFPGLPPAASTVLDQQLFYNNSAYDLGVGVDANDDLAIATDKNAYLPGGGAMVVSPVSFPNDQKSFLHLSSYSRGINGLMVDISGLHTGITVSDFTFKVGSNNSPSLWSAPSVAPTSVTVRTTGLGLAAGDTRVEIIWPNNSIRNTWLEVRVKANANTGLADNAALPNGDGTGHIFYFGSRVADSGSGQTVSFVTNATDEILARNNPGSALPVTNRFDYNKDKLVNATDQILARNNPGVLTLINIANPPAAPPAAPLASASNLESDDAIASALAATTPVVKRAAAAGSPTFNRGDTKATGGDSGADKAVGCPAAAERPAIARAKVAAAVDRLAAAWGQNRGWFRGISGNSWLD